METLMSGNEKILAMMYAMNHEINFEQLNRQPTEFADNLREEVLNTAEVKASTFNYCLVTDRKILVYNTLYNALIELTPNELRQLKSPEICGSELRLKFLSAGIFVTAETDERQNYFKWRQEFQKHLNYLSINITTTLKCNARCPYCYEHGVKYVDFDEKKIDALINFIKQHKKDSPLKLNWFGGEPFMNPKLIDAVTSRIAELGFQFQTFAITNGSLITRQMIRSKFKKWHLRGVQITLDGTAEQYEKRKAYVDGQRNVFQKILNRIEWLAAENIHVDVRLNIDRENMADILNLLYVLQGRFDETENVVYYPAFVTGGQNKLTESEKVSYIKEMFNALANPNKMTINRRLYSFPRNIACMRNDPQSFSVDVYGRVYNCEHLVGRPNESIGTLQRFSSKKNLERLSEPLRHECTSCIFLPKCMGGCASNLRTNDSACMIEKYMIQAYLAYMCD